MSHVIYCTDTYCRLTEWRDQKLHSNAMYLELPNDIPRLIEALRRAPDPRPCVIVSTRDETHQAEPLPRVSKRDRKAWVARRVRDHRQSANMTCVDENDRSLGLTALDDKSMPARVVDALCLARISLDKVESAAVAGLALLRHIGSAQGRQMLVIQHPDQTFRLLLFIDGRLGLSRLLQFPTHETCVGERLCQSVVESIRRSIAGTDSVDVTIIAADEHRGPSLASFRSAGQDRPRWIAPASLLHGLCQDPPELIEQGAGDLLFCALPVLGLDHGPTYRSEALDRTALRQLFRWLIKPAMAMILVASASTAVALRHETVELKRLDKATTEPAGRPHAPERLERLRQTIRDARALLGFETRMANIRQLDQRAIPRRLALILPRHGTVHLDMLAWSIDPVEPALTGREQGESSDAGLQGPAGMSAKIVGRILPPGANYRIAQALFEDWVDDMADSDSALRIKIIESPLDGLRNNSRRSGLANGVPDQQPGFGFDVWVADHD